MPSKWYCMEIWRATPEILSMPLDQRIKYMEEHMTVSSDGPFPANAFSSKAPISLGECAKVLSFFSIIMGGPLALLAANVGMLLFGSWASLGKVIALDAILALHPLPDPLGMTTSPFTLALYKYFTYRFMWVDDAMMKTSACKAWVGAGAPHGVLPLANFLSMPAINAFTQRRFIGGGASATLRTPFLRYLTVFGGATDVSKASLVKATSRGTCVGIVPDGIAGIFQQRSSTGSSKEERVALKTRKGLAKLCITKGIPIVPAYSLGNTTVFKSWYDKSGVMEAMSRYLQVSIFVFWGRFGLPLPFRTNISMIIGEPVQHTEILEEPSDALVDQVHQAVLGGISSAFDNHKEACGWGDRTLRFV